MEDDADIRYEIDAIKRRYRKSSASKTEEFRSDLAKALKEKLSLQIRATKVKNTLIQIAELLRDTKQKLSPEERLELKKLVEERNDLNDTLIPEISKKIRTTKQAADRFGDSIEDNIKRAISNLKSKKLKENSNKIKIISNSITDTSNQNSSNSVLEPAKKLLLENAIESGNFNSKRTHKFKLGNCNIISLGRYLRTDNELFYKKEGELSRCLLRAKSHGYPPPVTEGLARFLEKYPQNSWITVVPDKEDQFGRMTKLIGTLKIHKALGHLNFSDSFLQITDRNLRMTNLNKAERYQKINKAMHGKNIDLRGCKVIILDDICTTGATLNRAHECLIAQGAVDVQCIALANTI